MLILDAIFTFLSVCALYGLLRWAREAGARRAVRQGPVEPVFIVGAGDAGESLLRELQPLAEDLIRLSGLVPGADVKIDFTGIRPGEKLSEEWRFGSETATETAHAQISCVRPQHIATIDLAAVSYPVEGALYESSTELIFNRMQQLLQEGQPSGAPVPGRS